MLNAATTSQFVFFILFLASINKLGAAHLVLNTQNRNDPKIVSFAGIIPWSIYSFAMRNKLLPGIPGIRKYIAIDFKFSNDNLI